MPYDRRRIQQVIESTHIKLTQPKKAVSLAVAEICDYIKEKEDAAVATTLQDISRGGAKFSVPQSDSVSVQKLTQTHYHIDRMRSMIEEFYDEGNADLSILLANIEAQLARVEDDQLRP